MPATCSGLARSGCPGPPSDALFLAQPASLNIEHYDTTMVPQGHYISDSRSHGSHYPIFFRPQFSLLPSCLKQTILKHHLCCLTYPLSLSPKPCTKSFHRTTKNSLSQLFRGMASCHVSPLGLFLFTPDVLKGTLRLICCRFYIRKFCSLSTTDGGRSEYYGRKCHVSPSSHSIVELQAEFFQG
jgi:hypothetical protein